MQDFGGGLSQLAAKSGLALKPPAAYICPVRATARHTDHGPPAFLVGNRSMVGQRSLTPSILVRVQVPQPKQTGRPLGGLFVLFGHSLGEEPAFGGMAGRACAARCARWMTRRGGNADPAIQVPQIITVGNISLLLAFIFGADPDNSILAHCITLMLLLRYSGKRVTAYGERE